MADAFIYDHVRTPRGKGKSDGSLHEVTALALALAWPLNGGSVLLVDADPAGADIAAGYLQGATGPGAGAGAVATARGDLLDAVHGSAVALDATGSRLLLAGPAPFPPTRPGGSRQPFRKESPPLRQRCREGRSFGPFRPSIVP